MKIVSKLVTTTVASMILGGIAAPVSVEAATNKINFNEFISSKSISNRESFNIFEEHGINVKKILGDDEYKQALKQDLLRRGGTYVKRVKGGVKIALNSAVMKVLISGGVGAVGYYLAPLLAGIGLAGGAQAAIIGVVGTSLASAGSKATTRGCFVTVTQYGGKWHAKWGYQ